MGIFRPHMMKMRERQKPLIEIFKVIIYLIYFKTENQEILMLKIFYPEFSDTRKYLHLLEIFHTIISVFLMQRKRSHGYNDPVYCYSYSYNADSLMGTDITSSTSNHLDARNALR